MKPATWIVGGLLLLVVVAFSLWPRGSITHDATPPGQYPLSSEKLWWPVTRVISLYRPAAETGSDEVDYTAVDAKFTCGTAATCPQA